MNHVSFEERMLKIKKHIDFALHTLKKKKRGCWSWWIFPNSIIANPNPDKNKYNMNQSDYQKIIVWNKTDLETDIETDITLFIKFFFAICKTVIYNLLTNEKDEDIKTKYNDIRNIMGCGEDVGKFLAAVHAFYLCFSLSEHNQHFKHFFEFVFMICRFQNRIEDVLSEDYNTADKFISVKDKDKVKNLFKKFNVESLTEELYSMAINIKKLDCKIYDVNQQNKKVENSEYNIEFILEVNQDRYYCNFNNKIFNKLNIYTKPIQSLDCSKNHCYKINNNNLEKLSKVNTAKQKIEYYKINI